ncbi:MAG: helix-turn-helix domain-containing protein [Planctomycetota bacterium]
MAAGSKIRLLGRLLEQSQSIVWAIDNRHQLIYLSDAACDWLQVDAETLTSIDSSIDVDDQDAISLPRRTLSALGPPPGLADVACVETIVTPPERQGETRRPITVRFMRLGRDVKAILAIESDPSEPLSDDLRKAIGLHEALQRWRSSQVSRVGIATAGSSTIARRLRGRLQLVTAARTDLGIFGPKGSAAELIGKRAHALSAGDEPIAVIDGPLMDAELLDAVVSPVIGHLSESPQAMASVLVRSLDETPAEAQSRLCEVLRQFDGRLRLIAVCSRTPWAATAPSTRPSDPFNSDQVPSTDGLTSEALLFDGSNIEGVDPWLLDRISVLTLTVAPLASRVEDIPLMAAAALDARHAAGEGSADRFRRDAMDALVRYPWPDDFQELNAAIRQAIAAAPAATIHVEHLPLAIRSFQVGDIRQAGKRPLLPLDEAIRRFELGQILEQLDQSGGNRAEAARRLGISRARLIRRLDDAQDPGQDADQ